MKKGNFKTRARVVDLLGREQIADSPTAITELIKNSVDAQADNVWIHYHSKEKLIEIEDDGLGMRPVDFENRWLTLATDSKKNSQPDESWLKYATLDKKERARSERPFGEKGIGRLAIAALGKAVLLWTKWGKDKDTTRLLALVSWEIFQIPNFNLDDIEIHYVTLDESEDLQKYALLLYEETLKSVKKYSTNKNLDQSGKIKLNQIIVDLETEVLSGINKISPLFSNTNGTYFGILGTRFESEEFFYDLSKPNRGDDYIPAEGIRAVYGFCDPFHKDRKRIQIHTLQDGQTAFKADQNFWQPSDFKIADYEIEVKIDEKGFAKGKIRRHSEVLDYEFNITELPQRAFYPGPFEIKIGYVLGRSNESILTKDDFEAFNSRLLAYGGLYVYRNGIQVMPYGRHDEDFLGFEARRSKHAGKYVFSHRRMFGAIYISHKNNPDLVDKAGREGFIKNGYYRGLVTIGKEIFIDIANRYFGTKVLNDGAPKSKNEDIENEIKETTDLFLNNFSQSKRNLKESETILQRKLNKVKEHIRKASTGEINFILESEIILDELADEFQNVLDKLIHEIPSLAQPNQKVLAAWDSYITSRDQFEINWNNIILKERTQLDKILSKYSNKIARIQKLATRLSKNEGKIIHSITLKYEVTKEQIKHLEDRTKNWLSDQIKKVQSIPRRKLGDNPVESAIEGSEFELRLFEDSLNEQRKLLRVEFEPYWNIIIHELSRLNHAKSLEKVIGDLTREKEMLLERERTYAELAQIGLVVEGIDHEYRVLFNTIKSDLKILEENQKETKALSTIEHIREVFQAIDDRLSFLTPLFRAEKAIYVPLTGGDIRLFVDSRYPANKFVNIQIEYTKNFMSLYWKKTKKSVVLAAILNVINNAIDWIERKHGKGRIRFGMDPDGFVISDSGPGIDLRDGERIFEPFFSRRPNGRGLGLYLARTSLRGYGMDLRLPVAPLKGALSGANFLFVEKPIQLNEDIND